MNTRTDSAAFIGANGDVAARLLASGFNINSLRTNAILRKEEWLQFDTALTTVMQQRLRGVADLVSAGLTFNLPNAMGTTVLQWENSTDMTGASRSMEGITRSQDERLEFAQVNLPIYITHKDFNLNLRHLEASRKLGAPLDTTMASIAARKVADSIEDALFNGAANITVDGSTATGYRTAVGRQTGTITADWASATPTQIMTDVKAMIDLLHAKNYFGPYVIYVPQDAYTTLIDDYYRVDDLGTPADTRDVFVSPSTVLARILEIPDIAGVRVADTMTSAEIVMVQMTSDVVDMVIGEQGSMVQWESHGGFLINFKALSIMIPRMKVAKDSAGADVTGIAHLS